MSSVTVASYKIWTLLKVHVYSSASYLSLGTCRFSANDGAF